MQAARPAEYARQLEERVERALADRRVATAAVVGAAACVFALRYAVTLAHASAGPDYGHYLIAMNWYALNDNSGEGPFDPPAVPLLLLGLSVPLGRLGALQAAGPLAAACLLPAAYFLLSKFTPRWAALLGSTTFALWQQFSEFIAFGGVTNLFGIAVSLLAYRAFFEAMEKPSRGLRPNRLEIKCALLLFLVLSIHHLTAFVTGATLLLWAAVRVVADDKLRWPFLWSAARVFALAAALGAVYVPYLISLLDAEVASGFGQPNDLSRSLLFPGLVFRDTPWLWLLFTAFALTAFLRIPRRSGVFPFAVAILGAPVLLLFTVLATHPVRVLFFETFALVAVASFWAAREEAPHFTRRVPAGALRAARALFLGLVLLSTSLLPLAAPAQLENAIAEYHQFLTPGLLEAMDWVGDNAGTTSVIAIDRGIAPTFNDQWKGMATGWWVEGWSNRRAIYEANLILLSLKTKWDDARMANRLFAGENVFENGWLRVADNFPYDDAALPRILTGYLQDYREFVGFSSPRLLDAAGNSSYTLDDGAQLDATAEIRSGLGVVSGNYSGTGFHGQRLVAFDGDRNAVSLTMNFTLDPGATWDTLEVSLTVPSWTAADMAALDGGRIALAAPDFFGAMGEKGVLEFGLTNLTAPSQAPPYLSVGERGYGLRFGMTGSFVQLEATFTLTEPSETTPERHPLTQWNADEILEAFQVSHLFVGAESAANIQRFDREPLRFTRVFSNAAAVIFEVA